MHQERIFASDFLDAPLSQVEPQIYSGLILDSRSTFDMCIKQIMAKVNKTIGLIWECERALARSYLITIYKALIKHNLNYSDFFGRVF